MDMRAELKAVLEEFFDCHPQHAKNSVRRKRTAPAICDNVVDLSQDDIDAFVVRPRSARTGAGTLHISPQN
jgi:hypothetical protein